MGIPPSNYAYDPAAGGDITDGTDLAEFWDEGWTLEDEWQPATPTLSTVHLPAPQPVRLTEVIALL
jgi:hypothetical protein